MDRKSFSLNAMSQFEICPCSKGNIQRYTMIQLKFDRCRLQRASTLDRLAAQTKLTTTRSLALL